MPDPAQLEPAQLHDAPNPRRGLRPAWNSEQARQAALRSWRDPNSARFHKRNGETSPADLDAHSARNQRLELLQEQVTRTRDALNRKLRPQHRAALLRALCDLLDQQRIARGEPLPGSRRPAPERRSPEAIDVAPVPSLPGVAPALHSSANAANSQHNPQSTTVPQTIDPGRDPLPGGVTP